MNVNECSECLKKFSSSSNLKKHAKKFHLDKVDVIIPKKVTPHQCHICQKYFSFSRSLYEHKKNHHSSEGSESSQPRIIINKQCPLCTFSAQKDLLLDHFRNVHHLNITTTIIKFNSFDEFSNWKTETEKSTKSLFVKGSGTTVNKKNSIMIFNCHRSGQYVSKSMMPKKRYLKTQGSNKINGFCPASMKIILHENQCEVIFTSEHVGHDDKEDELGHLSLTLKERQMLASKISLKIPFSDILDEIRDSLDGSEIERLHLLTRKDLYNIEKSFNLNSSAVRHQNDAISVDAWVEEMKTSGCVLFYKGQNIESEDHIELRKEDFLLIVMNPGQEAVLKKYCSDCICIDGTHGLNQYSFELHTLLVLDDVREGFPCAFMISNRSDEQVMKIFFYYLKEKIGFKINCRVFMSDMAESYYNAWKVIMEPAEFRLFCTWHVDRSWRKNLSKINSKEKQVLVYKYLRTMLQERDKMTFSVLINYFLSNFMDDPDTKTFTEYFKNTYGNNISSWAYSYRLNCGLNTNMHIERMHRTIKYIYFHGQKVKRLDKALHNIQKFIRDRLFLRLIVHHKGKLSKKLSDLRKRHKISEELPIDSVVKNGNCWDVSSFSTNNFEIYSVEEIEPRLPCNKCKLLCNECNTCIHKYACTCIDSCIKWNMCKHIHLVCRFLKEKTSENPELTITDNNYLTITISVMSNCG